MSNKQLRHLADIVFNGHLHSSSDVLDVVIMMLNLKTQPLAQAIARVLKGEKI